MEEQLAEYYKGYLREMDYTESEIEEMGDPLVIQFRSFTAVRVLFLIGVALVAVGVFLFIRGYREN